MRGVVFKGEGPGGYSDEFLKRYKTDKVIESEAECNAVNEIFEINLSKNADKDDDKIVEFLLG